MSEFPIWIDRDRAASTLGCSAANVERAVADAGIKSKRFGRRLFFSRAGCERAGTRSDVLLSDANPFDVATITEPVPSKNRDRLGMSLEDAAEKSGLSVGELQGRLIGRAALTVNDNRLFVRVVDLDALYRDGTLPGPSDRAKVESVLAAASSDPAVDRRADEIGRALGVSDLEPASPDQKSDATGSQVVEAKPRKRRRLGAPRRWGTQG